MNQPFDMHYREHGFTVIKDAFSNTELINVRTVLECFHQRWLKENAEFYETKLSGSDPTASVKKGAINSAYITGKKHLDDPSRLSLFQFIGSIEMHDWINKLLPNGAMFMGTQLFFNPSNPNQQNYWHRDPQYHLTLEEQKEALKGPEVIHVRIALEDEPGLELVPGSHKQWDSAEELNVRTEQHGHKNSDDLTTGKVVKLDQGDVLIFSANMIHRGLYGKNRFAFDLLFCEPTEELAQFLQPDCLPSTDMLSKIAQPQTFELSIELSS